MKLKSKQEIDAAIADHGKVSTERKAAIVATVRQTRPEKMDELDAIFSEALTDEEKAFYYDIVEGRAEKPQPSAEQNGAAEHES